MASMVPHPECLNTHGEWDRRRAAQYRKKLTRSMREAIYERDDWTCQLCHLKFHEDRSRCRELGYAPMVKLPSRKWGSVALEIDHIIPIRYGGTHDPANLRSLCQPCNSKKHTRVAEKPECGAEVMDAADELELLH